MRNRKIKPLHTKPKTIKRGGYSCRDRVHKGRGGTQSWDKRNRGGREKTFSFQPGLSPAFPSGTQECERGPHPRTGTEPWPRSASQAGDSARVIWAGSSGSASVAALSRGQTPAKSPHSERLGRGMAGIQLPARGSCGMWPSPLSQGSCGAVSWAGRGWTWGCAIPTVLLFAAGALGQLPFLGRSRRGFSEKGLEWSQNEPRAASKHCWSR